MNATVRIKAPSEARPGLNAVPLAAVQSDGGGQYVWLVDEESMTVMRRGIQVEEGVGEYLRVVEGLQLGDKIVGAGGSYLAEGLAIIAWEG